MFFGGFLVGFGFLLIVIGAFGILVGFPSPIYALLELVFTDKGRDALLAEDPQTHLDIFLFAGIGCAVLGLILFILGIILAAKKKSAKKRPVNPVQPAYRPQPQQAPRPQYAAPQQPQFQQAPRPQYTVPQQPQFQQPAPEAPKPFTAPQPAAPEMPKPEMPKPVEEAAAPVQEKAEDVVNKAEEAKPEAPKPAFCYQCGAPLTGSAFCSNCGAKLK